MGTYFTIFGKDFSYYWLMGLIGIISVSFFLFARNKSCHLPKDDLIHLIALAVVGAGIGAKLMSMLTLFPLLIKNWNQWSFSLELWEVFLQGGYVFYGGLFGGGFAVYLYCRKYDINLETVMELAAPAIPLFHVFGRIGCYLSGCCYGIDGFPIQLVEAGVNLFIFFGILLYQKYLPKRGISVCWYLIIYGVARFILEFFRGDAIRGFVGFFSVSQWVSLVLIILALVEIKRRRLF